MVEADTFTSVLTRLNSSLTLEHSATVCPIIWPSLSTTCTQTDTMLRTLLGSFLPRPGPPVCPGPHLWLIPSVLMTWLEVPPEPGIMIGPDA